MHLVSLIHLPSNVFSNTSSIKKNSHCIFNAPVWTEVIEEVENPAYVVGLEKRSDRMTYGATTYNFDGNILYQDGTPPPRSPLSSLPLL